MSTERDMTRIVRSWLRTDEHESADRVLDNVLALLDATPQRRSWWPARRIADMNTVAKLATSLAAVVVAAVVVVNLLPGNGPGAAPTPSPSLSPSLSPSPAPSAASVAFPPDGPLAAGRQSMTRGGVRLSVNVPAGWHSDQGYFITKDVGLGPDGASFLFWDPDAVGVYADPCAQHAGPVVGPTTADLAAAMTTIPDTTLVSGPTDVTVGGRPAKHVVLTVSEDVACGGPGHEFYLWYADEESAARYATVLGATLSVWIVDVDGTRLSIDAESYKGAGPEIEREVQAIIDSIQFE
jgi:hypothetical protein